MAESVMEMAIKRLIPSLDALGKAAEHAREAAVDLALKMERAEEAERRLRGKA